MNTIIMHYMLCLINTLSVCLVVMLISLTEDAGLACE